MDIDIEFPAKFYMNLASRQDRRAYTQEEFLRQNLEVERFPSVNARWVNDYRGMWNEGRYACGLTQRMIIRKARQMKAPAVLIFEDDVVLHENFRELTEAIELPEDWGIFYLGCQHIEIPERVGLGLVRVRRSLDMHAVAIRAPYYNRVIEALTPPGKGSEIPTEPSDVALADLHDEIPTYAAYPNLAWQRINDSDLADRHYSSYFENGRQRYRQESIHDFNKEERNRSGSIFTWKDLKLHLGAGNNRLDNGWINLERGQVDITKPLKFGDESVKAIYLEHVIEHIPPRRAYHFFGECLRVLQSEGVLRLAFPCIEKIWKAQSEKYALFLQEKGWGDGDQRSVIKTLIFEHGHQAVWTENSMRATLESLGFHVEAVKVSESKHPDFLNVEQHWREVGREINEIETVCLEATKPSDWVAPIVISEEEEEAEAALSLVEEESITS